MKSLGNSFKYHVYPHVYENDETSPHCDGETAKLA